jgi:tetratricopeptide (TPR) repeat protein
LWEARTTIEAHVDSDPYNYARSLIALGKLNVRAGRHELALGFLNEGLEIMRLFRSDYRLAEAWGLLGQIAESGGDTPTAEKHYREALHIYVALNAGEAQTIEERLYHLELGKGTG